MSIIIIIIYIQYRILYRGVSFLDCTRQVPILDFRGLCISHPQDRVLVKGTPPPLQDGGWRQVPDPTMTEHGICPGP